MNTINDLKKLIEEKGMTFEQLAIELSKNDKKISAQKLLQKFDEQKLRFNEVQKILDILGYKLVFRKNKTNLQTLPQ